MDLTTVLVFVVVFLISYYIFTRPKHLPPGPLRLPILGSVFVLSKFRQCRPHEVLLNEAKKYGDVMSFWFGKTMFVVLTGSDVIHEAFVKQPEVFSDRPGRPVLVHDAGDVDAEEYQDTPEFLKKMSNGGIILQKYGDTWRKLRRFTLQSLRDFGVGKTSIEEKIFTELDVVSKAFQESDGRPMCTSSYTQKLVGNVLYGIIFGKRYEYDDPVYDNLREILSTLLSGDGFLSVTEALPKFLSKFFNQKVIELNIRKIECIRQVRKYIADEIKEHEMTFDKDNIRDFVDIFLQTKQSSDSDEDNIDVANMFRVIMDLFIAGSETTYVTLDWCLLYMCEFPEIQSKCQKEIQEVFGDKSLKYADREKLPYIQATLMEIQRVASNATFGVIHSTTRETTLRGYTIPAGTTVLPNLYSASFDPKHWDEPNEFSPDRFLDNSGSVIKKEAFIPFSTGPRVCLGEPLAKMELFVVFANLVQRFKFRREHDDVPQSLKPKPFHVTNVPLPYKLRVYKC